LSALDLISTELFSKFAGGGELCVNLSTYDTKQLACIITASRDSQRRVVSAQRVYYTMLVTILRCKTYTILTYLRCLLPLLTFDLL